MALDRIIEEAAKSKAGEIAYRHLFKLLYKDGLTPTEIIYAIEKDDKGNAWSKYGRQLENFVEGILTGFGVKPDSDEIFEAKKYAVNVFEEMLRIAEEAEKSKK